MRCKLRQDINSFEERCGGFQKAFSHQELDAQQQSMVQQEAALQSQVLHCSPSGNHFLQLCLAAVQRFEDVHSQPMWMFLEEYKVCLLLCSLASQRLCWQRCMRKHKSFVRSCMS